MKLTITAKVEIPEGSDITPDLVKYQLESDLRDFEFWPPSESDDTAALYDVAVKVDES